MVRDGHLDRVTDVVERFTGRKPKALRELMLERRHTWPKAPVAQEGARGGLANPRGNAGHEGYSFIRHGLFHLDYM